MKLLTTLSELDWITTGVAGMQNATVAHCIPPIFPAYAKVFHPIHEDSSILDDRLTWQEEEKARPPEPKPDTETARIIADLLESSTLVYGGARAGSCLHPIRWAELAGRLGMPFVPTISAASFTRQFPEGSWPRRLIGPTEGSLADLERDALISVLHGHTSVDRILFHYWFLKTMEVGDDKMFEGALGEASLFPSDELGVHGTPTHWFPDDRSWLVCSDNDLTFTLVGGSEALIHQLLDHTTLECVAVTAATRVDWKADLDGSALS